MTTYNNALSKEASEHLRKQYGYGAPRYVAVASWRTILKAFFYDLRGFSMTSALVRSNHPAQLHYGVWDKKYIRTFDGAIRRATDSAFQQLFPHYAEEEVRIIDFGSGFGGADLQLCKMHNNLSTTGVSIDPVQTAIANKLALKMGLKDRTKFIQGNFLSLVLPNNDKYSGGIAMESLCHVPASQQSLLWKNISNVLEPPSRFVIHDWFLDKELNQNEEKQLQVFLKGWDMPDCVSSNVMIKAAKENGFRLVSDNDLTPFILKSAKKIRFRGILCRPIILWSQGKKSSYLRRLSFSDPSTVDFLNTCLIQEELFKSKVITYKQLVFQQSK